jgi:hypothetical protein
MELIRLVLFQNHFQDPSGQGKSSRNGHDCDGPPDDAHRDREEPLERHILIAAPLRLRANALALRVGLALFTAAAFRPCATRAPLMPFYLQNSKGPQSGIPRTSAAVLSILPAHEE